MPKRMTMDEAIDDCLIEGYEHLIPSLTLPDKNDCHVLAAAIHGKAQVILTFNLRHFPNRVLTSFGITAQHPDDFLAALVDNFADDVKEIVEEMRVRKTMPELSREEMLRKIGNQKLQKFIARLHAVGYGQSTE